MVRPKNETKDLLLSTTKNCETLVHQIHTKPGETLEFKMNKPREIFHFKPPIHLRGEWMIGSVDLEVCKSNFNIQNILTNLNFINFLMKKLVVFHMKKPEMKLKETRIFQILHQPIYKMK